MILGKGERKQKKPKKRMETVKKEVSSPNKIQSAISECLQIGYNDLTPQPVSLLETILLYAQNPAFLLVHEEPSSLQLLS